MLTRDFISFAAKQTVLDCGKQGAAGSFHTRPRQRLCRLGLGDRQWDQRSPLLTSHGEWVACRRRSRCLALAVRDGPQPFIQDLRSNVSARPMFQKRCHLRKEEYV